MKHTKGPWTICKTMVDKAMVRWHITGPTHGSIHPICEHVIEINPEASEQAANMYLIAAAPDLLEAAKVVVGSIKNTQFVQKEIDSLKKAIAKAEGK